MEEKFWQAFPITDGVKDKPYLVLFDAYIGYGKSYVARMLSRMDGSIVIDNNEVRYLLNDYADQQAEAWHKLQDERVKQLLAHGNSLIMDNCLPINYERKLDKYRALGYPIYIIRLLCSEGELRRRLEKRRFDPPRQYSVINYDDAMKIRADHDGKLVPDDLINYTIDTEQPIEPQLKSFLAKFNLKQ